MPRERRKNPIKKKKRWKRKRKKKRVDDSDSCLAPGLATMNAYSPSTILTLANFPLLLCPSIQQGIIPEYPIWFIFHHIKITNHSLPHQLYSPHETLWIHSSSEFSLSFEALFRSPLNNCLARFWQAVAGYLAPPSSSMVLEMSCHFSCSNSSSTLRFARRSRSSCE